MSERLKMIIIPYYYFVWETYIRFMNWFYKPVTVDYKSIPILINNCNRLTFMKQLIDTLVIKGYTNIHIIDNASTYKPLLAYYDTCPYTVYRLKENVGFLSLWKTNIYKNFQRNFFVYTDSDVVPTASCPDDFLNTFLNLMKSNPKLMKVGLSLKIDDLPLCFDKREDVIAWEKQYFNDSEVPGYYNANIDTTFALYRPFMTGGASRLKMLRSKRPFEAYHMPWYNDSKNMSDEELYYIQNAKTSTHWTSKK